MKPHTQAKLRSFATCCNSLQILKFPINAATLLSKTQYEWGMKMPLYCCSKHKQRNKRRRNLLES
jgi:hypothetical protein